MTQREAGLAALNAMPNSLRHDLTALASFREWLGQRPDYALNFPGSQSDTSRRALCEVVRNAMSSPEIGHHDVPDLNGNFWQIEVCPGEIARRVKLHPPGGPLELPHAYVFSGSRDERLAGFGGDAKALRLDPACVERWSRELEAGAFDEYQFTLLHEDLAAVPDVVRASIAESLSDRDMRIDILVPEDDRYYVRLIGTPSPPSNFDGYIKWFGSHLANSDSFDPSLLHLCVTPSLAGEIAKNITEEHLDECCAFAIKGGILSRLATVEVALRAPESVVLAATPKIVELASSLIDIDVTAPGNLFEQYVSLACFVMSRFAGNHQLAKMPAYVRRLAGFAHASVLEASFSDAGVNLAALDFKEVTSDAALYFGSMADFREENRWHADHLNPPEVQRWIKKRLLHASLRKDPTPLQKIVSQKINPAENASVWDICSPDPIVAASEVIDLSSSFKDGVRQALSKRPLNVESFMPFIWAAETGWVDRALADDVASSLADTRYSIAGSDNSSAAFSLLQGLAYGAAVARSEKLANGVNILTRNFRNLFKKLTFEQEIRLALVCAAWSADPDEWAAFAETWFWDLANTDLTATEAAQFRMAIEQLGSIAPALAKIGTRLDAILDAASWLPDELRSHS